jgi:single-stranded DNA-specific DHH superfamily exonuclease
VVTFTVDFSALARNRHMVLLAIVHSGVDGVTAADLTGATLRELVLNSHHVAARVVKAV